MQCTVPASRAVTPWRGKGEVREDSCGRDPERVDERARRGVEGDRDGEGATRGGGFHKRGRRGRGGGFGVEGERERAACGGRFERSDGRRGRGFGVSPAAHSCTCISVNIDTIKNKV
jgi:hypothetical protein